MKDDNYVVGVGRTKDDVKNINRTKRVLAKYNREQTVAIALGSAMGNVISDAFHGIVGVLKQATYAVKRFSNAFTVEPMREGLNEYETMLTTIRTMTMNAEGWYRSLADEAERYAASQDDVSRSLDNLNDYADKTIYKFADMTRGAQRFVTQGLTVGDSEQMTRGIASLTAYLGGDANAYTTAITAFSHSMSQGRMYAMQYNELASANLVGERMKQLLIDSAKILGKDVPDTFSDAYHPDDGDGFKQTVNDWVDASVLLVGLGKIMGGTYETTEQLKESLMALEAEHGMTIDESYLTEEFLQRMLELRNNAFDASTQVKTLSQFMDALKESIGTGWTKIWSSFFGDFNQASTMWTNLLELITDSEKGNNVGTLMDSIVKSIDADFVAKGGYEYVSQILTNIWYIIRNVGNAFGELLSTLSGGKSVGEVLLNAVKAIAKFTGWLAKGNSLLVGIFKGLNKMLPSLLPLFKVFVNLGKLIIGGIAYLGEKAAPYLNDAFNAMANALQELGEWLSGIHIVFDDVREDFSFVRDEVEATKKEFSDVGKAIKGYLAPIKAIGAAIVGLFVYIGNMINDETENFVKKYKNNEFYLFFKEIFDTLASIVDLGKTVVSALKTMIQMLIKAIQDLVGHLGGITWDDVTAKFQEILDFFKELIMPVKGDPVATFKKIMAVVVQLFGLQFASKKIKKTLNYIGEINTSLWHVIGVVLSVMILIKLLESIDDASLASMVSKFSKLAYSFAAVLISLGIVSLLGSRMAIVSGGVAAAMLAIMGIMLAISEMLNNGRTIEEIDQVIQRVLLVMGAFMAMILVVGILIAVIMKGQETIERLRTAVTQYFKSTLTLRMPGMIAIGIGVMTFAIADVMRSLVDFINLVKDMGGPDLWKSGITAVLLLSAVIGSLIGAMVVMSRVILKHWYQVVFAIPYFAGMAIAIKALTNAVASMVEAMLRLSVLTKSGDIVPACVSLIGLFAVIAIAIWSLSNGLRNVVFAVASLLLSAAVLVFAIKELGTMSDAQLDVAIDRMEKIAWAIAAVFAVILGIGALEKLLGQGKNVMFLSASVAIITGSIATIVVALWALSNLSDVKDIWSLVGLILAVGGVVIALVAMVSHAARKASGIEPKAFIGVAAAVAIVCGAITTILVALTALSYFTDFGENYWKVMGMFAGVAALVAGIILSIAMLAKYSYEDPTGFSKVLLSTAAAITAIGVATAGIILSTAWLTKTFEGQKSGTIRKTMETLFSIMSFVSGMTLMVSIFASKVDPLDASFSKRLMMYSILIGSIGASIASIVASLALYSAVSEPDTISEAFIIIETVTSCLGGMMALTMLLGNMARVDAAKVLQSTILIGVIAGAITTVVASFALLMWAMGDLDMGRLWQGMGVILITISVFAGIAVALGALSQYTVIGAGVMAVIAGAVMVLAVASAILAGVGSIFAESVTEIVDALLYAAVHSAGILTGATSLLTSLAILSVGAFASTFAIASMYAVAYGILTIGNAMALVSEHVLGLENATVALSKFYQIVQQIVFGGLNTSGLRNSLFEVAKTFAEFDYSGFNYMQSKFEKFISDVQELRDSFDDLSVSVAGFNGAVSGVGLSISNGIKGTVETVQNKGQEWTTALNDWWSEKKKVYLVMPDGTEMDAWLDDRLGSKLRGGN